MNTEELKLFVAQARVSAPEDVCVVEDPTKNVPNGHEYAIVEVLDDTSEGVLFRYVATGDREGICWAWTHTQKNHPRKANLRIMDIRKLGASTSIDLQ